MRASLPVTRTMSPLRTTVSGPTGTCSPARNIAFRNRPWPLLAASSLSVLARDAIVVDDDVDRLRADVARLGHVDLGAQARRVDEARDAAVQRHGVVRLQHQIVGGLEQRAAAHDALDGRRTGTCAAARPGACRSAPAPRPDRCGGRPAAARRRTRPPRPAAAPCRRRAPRPRTRAPPRRSSCPAGRGPS